MKKRILSLALVLALCLGLVSVTATAAEETSGASLLSIDDEENTWTATIDGVQGTPGTSSGNKEAVLVYGMDEAAVETNVTGVQLFAGGAWWEGGFNDYHLDYMQVDDGTMYLSGSLGARCADGLTAVSAENPVPGTGSYFKWVVEADGILEVKAIAPGDEKDLWLTRNGERVEPDYYTEHNISENLLEFGVTVSTGDVITACVVGGVTRLGKFSFTPCEGEVSKEDVTWDLETISDGARTTYKMRTGPYRAYEIVYVTGPFVGWQIDTTQGRTYRRYADEIVLECYNSEGELVSSSSQTRRGNSHHFEVVLPTSDTYTFKTMLKRDGEAAALECEPWIVNYTRRLDAPSISTLNNAGNGAVTVSWYKVDDIDGYNVYYRDWDSEDWTLANQELLPTADKSMLSYTVSGLEIGTKYEFRVDSVRSSTGEAKSSPYKNITVLESAEASWAFQYFGESTKASNNRYSGGLSDGGTSVRVIAGKAGEPIERGGKLVRNRTDGIGLYYTAIPASTNWTLRAKMHVNQWYDDKGQTGAGLGVYDRVPKVTTGDKYWNNSYVAAAMGFRYEGRTMRMATGSVARYGVPQGYSDLTSTPETFVSRVTPLDLRFTQNPDLPFGYCNIIGNRYVEAPEQELVSYYEPPQNVYTDLIFELQKNNTGYIARQYDAETGELLGENIEYFVNGACELSGTDVDARNEVEAPSHRSAMDPDFEYVGFFTARVMDATFSDVVLTTIAPEDDEPAQRPPVAVAATHTATFMVGDEVIDQVAFDEGAASLAEPALPTRENYIGAWESYDLASATTDIVVQGRYTPIDPDKVSDVEGRAEATYDDGTATITLNATAASQTIKVTSETTKPVDVVLVLDQSGSMKETMSTKDRQSKRDALVNCADQFVRSLHDNAVKTGADHRVAVVGFAYSAYNQGKYKNTGLLATPSGKSVNYQNLKDADYKTALLPINNGGAINSSIISGIQSIVADGATAADLGLRMAQNIFAENPTDGDRQRVVIFITDGTPTAWGETASLITSTAADAISEANNIKNGQDAKIYSVGVHANADATAAFSAATNGITTDNRGNFASYDFNRFLHAVSSNYPAAKSMANLGEGDKTDGYYMAVTDTSNLQSIFTNILYSTVYELKNFDKVTFRYTLPATFSLTVGQEMDLREDLRTRFDLTDDDIRVARKDDGTTQLTIYGVPAQESYDADGALIYQATVSFQAASNQLASGATAAGSGNVGYGNATLSEFEANTVTVPVGRKLVAFTIGSQVYQIDEVELGDPVVVPESRLAIWELDDPETVVTGDYAVFAASRGDIAYAANWVMGDARELKYYRLGETVKAPDASLYAPEGYEFSGWSSNIPATMPAYDVTCTAIYSPKHVHSFVKVNQTGTCTDGIITLYRCACGEEKSEQAQSEAHNFTAVFSDSGSAGNAMSKLACTKCGYSQEQNLTFKVASSQRQGWKLTTTVLDLSLYQNEVSVTEPDEDVEIRFYIGEDANGKTYAITRINADGSTANYKGKVEDGYLVFQADHFSIYAVGEVDEEATGDVAEGVSYQEALDILNSKEDVILSGGPEAPEPAATPGNTGGNTGNTSGGSAGGGGSLGGGGGAPAPVQNVPTSQLFADVVAGSWYEAGVTYVVEKGLFNGVSETSFAPGDNMTRAMLMTVLARLDGQDTAGGETWYAKGMDWAKAEGVSDGTMPEANVTREQLVTMLYRYAEATLAQGDLTGFADAGQVSTWAQEAMTWAVSQGIITGKGNATLDPQGTATRAEVATILQRYVEKMGK